MWAVGEILTAANFGTYLRDNTDYLKGKADAYDTHASGTAAAQHDGGAGDHTHQSAGAQGGQLDHGLALTGLTDDDHTIYVKKAGDTMTGNLTISKASPVINLTDPGGRDADIYATGDEFVIGEQGVATRVKFALGTGEMTEGIIPTVRIKEYAVDTYTGNGSGATRQITTGFAPEIVILHMTDFDDANNENTVWIIQRDNASVHVGDGVATGLSGNVKLDATDGFHVGSAANEANRNAFTGIYFAIG